MVQNHPWRISTDPIIFCDNVDTNLFRIGDKTLWKSSGKIVENPCITYYLSTLKTHSTFPVNNQRAYKTSINIYINSSV